MLTIDEALKNGIARLMGASGSPRLDAQLILGHVIGQPREYLIAHSEQTLVDLQQQTFDKLLTLRTKGMPVAYILGQRPFFDRTFKVTSNVLIPRPETELLVETALSWAKGRGPLRIIDVGTGSGVIALSLAAKLPKANVVATDVSASAVLVARDNAGELRNIRYIQADLLAPMGGKFDIICANLPYIATGELDILEVAKFEPHVALDGGKDGLFLIRRLLEQAPARLSVRGLLLMEIGADQGQAVQNLAKAAFPMAAVSLLKDDAGLDRVVRVER